MRDNPEVFNTDLTIDTLKVYIVERGIELLPSNLWDASGFCDIGTIHHKMYLNIGVHVHEEELHKTVRATRIEDKSAATMNTELGKYFEACEERKVDVIGMVHRPCRMRRTPKRETKNDQKQIFKKTLIRRMFPR